MHPEVADVAVIGVPNDDLGEEVRAVVQLVDPEPGGQRHRGFPLLAWCGRAAGCLSSALGQWTSTRRCPATPTAS